MFRPRTTRTRVIEVAGNIGDQTASPAESIGPGALPKFAGAVQMPGGEVMQMSYMPGSIQDRILTALARRIPQDPMIQRDLYDIVNTRGLSFARLAQMMRTFIVRTLADAGQKSDDVERGLSQLFERARDMADQDARHRVYCVMMYNIVKNIMGLGREFSDFLDLMTGPAGGFGGFLS